MTRSVGVIRSPARAPYVYGTEQPETGLWGCARDRPRSSINRQDAEQHHYFVERMGRVRGALKTHTHTNPNSELTNPNSKLNKLDFYTN